ncbi:MAG: iron-containing alcohol dehydrogenase [Chloroflexi bacterium]|nr:iron-containing alcohol dehydrogenase [Chloroflexota bacterium]
MADIGLDVLVHAIEVYTSTWANDFIDAQQLRAIRLVFQYLPPACADGNDLEAREKMANGAALAGFGLANANVTLAHCLAHSLGGHSHPPHGRARGCYYLIQWSILLVQIRSDTGDCPLPGHRRR